MVATVLNSRRAVEMSVYVVRAFVKLREVIATHRALGRKLAHLEAQTTDSRSNDPGNSQSHSRTDERSYAEAPWHRDSLPTWTRMVDKTRAGVSAPVLAANDCFYRTLGGVGERLLMADSTGSERDPEPAASIQRRCNPQLQIGVTVGPLFDHTTVADYGPEPSLEWISRPSWRQCNRRLDRRAPVPLCGGIHRAHLHTA